MSFNLICHIIKGLMTSGPTRAFWMFAFERINSWICSRITNCSFPEVTFMETHQVCHCYNYSSNVFSLCSDMLEIVIQCEVQHDYKTHVPCHGTQYM